MAEAAIYFILLLGFCILDIRKMAAEKSKREIIPYLLLVIMAGFLGFTSFKSPYGNSIAHHLIRLFHVRG